MIMDTDAVEACRLAAGDEGGEVGQASTNRNAEAGADGGHLTGLLRFRRRRYGAWSGLRTAQADSRMSGTGQIASDREARLGESGHGFAGISAVRAAHMRSIGADDGGRACAFAPRRDPLFPFPPPDCILYPPFFYAKIPTAKHGRYVLLPTPPLDI